MRTRPACAVPLLQRVRGSLGIRPVKATGEPGQLGVREQGPSGRELGGRTVERNGREPYEARPCAASVYMVVAWQASAFLFVFLAVSRSIGWCAGTSGAHAGLLLRERG